MNFTFALVLISFPIFWILVMAWTPWLKQWTRQEQMFYEFMTALFLTGCTIIVAWGFRILYCVL